MTTQIYWAAMTSQEAVDEAFDRINAYYKVVQYNTLGDLWYNSYQLYNMSMTDGGTSFRDGEQGELVIVSVNHYRSILSNLLTMTTSQRPSFEPRAVNSDTRSQKQAILARGLLDYYMREKRLERALKQACEFGLMFGEGFIETLWDATTGEVIGIDPETKIEVHEGDLAFNVYEPIDVIRDVSVENYEQCQWFIVRKLVNKFDLAAKYPEHKDDILAKQYKYNRAVQYKPYWQSGGNIDDLCVMYTMYHARTEAVPNGRMIKFIDDDIVLEDQTLPYRNVPLYRVAPAQFNRTPFGYSPMFDLCSPQETVNGLYSTVRTNQEAFGTINVWTPPGVQVNSTQLNGMNLIQSEQPPQPINLLATSPEIFTTIQMMEQVMETLSGVNSVARGNPEASLKSGAALALVQSMAIQSAQGIQSSYIQLLEDVGTAMITILRDYASVPRVAMIVGKNNRSMMKEFTGADLSQINRVIVDAGNPMTRTTAGKVQLAEYLIQAKQIDSPEQLLQVINTGNLEPLTEGRTNELLCIKMENELLSDGQRVPVLITDMHLQHINEHKNVVADPMARNDPVVIEAVTAHIVEHYRMLSDPANAPLIALMGQQPMPSMQQQVSPAAAANVMQGGNVIPNANEMAGAMAPNLPQAPKNPLTGERAELQPGTATSTPTGTR